MILKRLEARNILKYRQLLLADLPAHGQIAVAGPNEAGKTAVGETICLGLFGQTFSLGPDDLDKVIRWGEYGGSVTVEFTGSDGGDYTIVREIDNTGKHIARLYLSGESTEEGPLVEGTDAVAEAVRELGGFTYKSFIDSFYLAQREMEMPHGKSETIKALIGVDRLETAAGELQAEITETITTIGTLETQIQDGKRKISQINLDPAQLGRLESQRDANVKTAVAAEKESDNLSSRANSVGKTATAFIKAAEMFVRSTPRTSYEQWRDRKQCVATGLVAAAKASQASGIDAHSPALETTGAAVQTFEHGLAQYNQIRNLAGLYRQRLAYLLDDGRIHIPRREDDRQPGGESDAPFAERRAAALMEIVEVTRRRRLCVGLGIFFLELALFAWVGWAVLLAAPESTIGGWLQAVIALGETGRQLLLLFGAIGATTLTGLFTAHYLRETNEMREGQRTLENIDTQSQIARVEMGVIDAMDEAAMPDALEALRGVRNDLLSSAVVSFVEREGTVLVKPDALAAKLAEIREGSTRATRSLTEAQQRFTDRAADLKRHAMELQATVKQLDEKITEEGRRWEQVEALERTVAGLQAKASELRHAIVVRKLACELIDAACQRIYSRFHPELRRFVSKLLPRLTGDRYEHLELDEDLRVRVFCKEKNDFVGLAELSNGTHRQLMLCVRLALSQALIASSSKAAQFLFFDEPFAFFDERRMARAIDVLRKISPQITQVFLAAQKFENPEAFDMVLHCDVDDNCLEASGDGLSHTELPTWPALSKVG